MTNPSPWRATVLTLFPEMFPGPLGVSLVGKAHESGLWAIETRDIRDSATDRHRSVDDTPAGGGPGMVMRADVLAPPSTRSESARPPKIYQPARSTFHTGPRRRVRRRSRPPDRLRTVRRDGPASDRRPQPRGDLPWRFRAVGGRNRGYGPDRCLRAAHSGRPGEGSLANEESLEKACSNTPNTPARSCSRGFRSRRS